MSAAEKPKSMLEEVFNRLLARGNDDGGPTSFSNLVKAAALDPSRDFVGASLRDMDFRDEDLRGFDFSFADLSGSDFRRANVSGASFEGAKLTDAIGLQATIGFRVAELFVSYVALDDIPPPSSSKDRGFVTYLMRQLRFDLSQLGLPDEVLWHARAKIWPGDIFSEAIREALNRAELFVVILSRNYVTSAWCDEELSTMVSRVMRLDAQARKRRIFRVDKHHVPEHLVPKQLQTIHPVKFYEENESDGITEYYWRGKVRRNREYENAVYELARAIYKTVESLGMERIR